MSITEEQYKDIMNKLGEPIINCLNNLFGDDADQYKSE